MSAWWKGPVVLGFTLILAGAPAANAQPALTSDQALDRLLGDWSMVGTVRGRQVEYHLEARRVLGGKFVELHMVDVQRPPQYEARVFLGYDARTEQLIAHWLDSSGAAGSIPHGTGTVAGATIQFEIPYITRTFRDVFVYDPDKGVWHFKIEAATDDGGWALFADYVVRPKLRAR